MLRLSKKADYGLMALSYLGRAPADTASTAREIAAAYGIPEQLMAKVLQRLKAVGMLESTRGKAGGYTLARSPEAINVREVVEAVDGPVTLVNCNFSEDHGCEQFDLCEIKAPLEKLNERVMNLLAKTTIEEILL